MSEQICKCCGVPVSECRYARLNYSVGFDEDDDEWDGLDSDLDEDE